MKYIAQPQFAANTVEIYEFPLTSTPFITLGPFPDGPNSVLIYQDSSGVTPAFYLFIAFAPSDPSAAGSAGVYNLNAIIANGSSTQGPPSLVPLATLTMTTDDPNEAIDGAPQPVGMAIQPGTGDLFVATGSTPPNSNVGSAYGTVNVFNRTQGAAGAPDKWGQTDSPALSFDSSGAIAGVVSNLAFDRHGNLWLTTFDGGGNYLCCLTVASVPSFSTYLKFVNGAIGAPGSVLPSTLLCTQLPALGFAAPSGNPSLYPFSGSEGIAFDPAGNLWLANNNDEYLDDVNPKITVNEGGQVYKVGGGSLLQISGAWLDSQFYPNLAAEANTVGDLAVTTATSFNGASPATTWWLNDAAQFGGLSFDGYTLYINDENNYNSDGPVVWQCDTSNVAGPASPNVLAFQASFQPSGVNTTNPGNGSMSIFSFPYTNPGLTIRDVLGDVGKQPDSAVSGESSGQLWESPDILVNNTQDPPPGVTSYGTAVELSTNPSTPTFGTTGTLHTGSDAYISVRVTNFDSANSTDTAILKLYWGFASTGLDWPAPWDGSSFYGPANLPLGGVIGEMQLPVISGRSEMYVQIKWPADEIPDPSNYVTAAGGSVAQSGHFCLLARIEASSVYPFGMCFPEEIGAITAAPTALHDNVSNNSAIGWRNIAIAPVSGGVTFGPDFRVHVLGANYGADGGHFTFGMQTLNRGGEINAVRVRVVVTAEGRALERLLAAGLEDQRCKYLGEGRFEMRDIDRGMSKIHLPAGELLPFTVEFRPEEDVRDFALRVIQYAHKDGVERVYGGQTFVFGRVKGFSDREK